MSLPEKDLPPIPDAFGDTRCTPRFEQPYPFPPPLPTDRCISRRGQRSNLLPGRHQRFRLKALRWRQATFSPRTPLKRLGWRGPFAGSDEFNMEMLPACCLASGVCRARNLLCAAASLVSCRDRQPSTKHLNVPTRPSLARCPAVIDRESSRADAAIRRKAWS